MGRDECKAWIKAVSSDPAAALVLADRLSDLGDPREAKLRARYRRYVRPVERLENVLRLSERSGTTLTLLLRISERIAFSRSYPDAGLPGLAKALEGGWFHRRHASLLTYYVRCLLLGKGRYANWYRYTPSDAREPEAPRGDGDGA